MAKRSRSSSKTTAGRIDVRDPKDVAPFEALLTRGPMAIVLVYADWCGHCTHFKEQVWNNKTLSQPSKLNAAAVHYNMVNDTSMKNAKIDGYPSVFLVGKDKKAEPIKTPANSEELVSMLNTTPKSNMNTSANVNTEIESGNILPENENDLSTMPPNLTADVVNQETNSVTRGGGLLSEGLYSGLLNWTQQAAPAALLTGAALLRGGRSRRHRSRRALRKSTQRRRR